MTGHTHVLTHLVGRNILEKRRCLGLTQEELAEKIGIGQQSLSRMETGRMAPKFERLAIIADALDCSVENLFHTEEQNTELLTARIAAKLAGLEQRKQERVLQHLEDLVDMLRVG